MVCQSKRGLTVDKLLDEFPFEVLQEEAYGAALQGFCSGGLEVLLKLSELAQYYLRR